MAVGRKWPRHVEEPRYRMEEPGCGILKECRAVTKGATDAREQMLPSDPLSLSAICLHM